MSQSPAVQPASGKSSLLRNSAKMAIATLISRVLGFVKGAVLTLAIGTAVAGNAFTAGNSLPNQLYILIVGGALNAILVPQIVRASKAKDGGADFINRLLTLGITFFLGLTLVALALFVPLFDIFAPNNEGVTRQLGLMFALWCVPQIFFYCLFTLLGHMLNARENFGPYTWAPVFNNLVAILGAVLFIILFGSYHEATNDPAFWGPGPILLIGGFATLGVALQAIVLIPSLKKVGITYRWTWGFRGMGLANVGKIGLWTIAALALGQVTVIAFNVALGAANTASAAFVASNDPANNPIVGAFGFNMIGYVVFMLPQSLIVVSLVTAIFPRMSHAAVDRDFPLFREHFSQAMRAYVPAMMFGVAGLIALAEPVVSLATFGAPQVQVEAMAVVTQILLLGVPGFAAIFVIKRAFYAFEDGRTPFLLQIPVTAVTWVVVLVALWLAPDSRMAIWAAWSSTIGNTLAVIPGLWALRRRIGSLDGRRIAMTYARATLVTLITTLIGWSMATLMDPLSYVSLWGAMLTGILVGAVMLALFIGLCVIFRVEEMLSVVSPLLRRARLGRFLPAGVAGGAAIPAAAQSDDVPPAIATEGEYALQIPYGPDGGLTEVPGGFIPLRDAPYLTTRAAAGTGERADRASDNPTGTEGEIQTEAYSGTPLHLDGEPHFPIDATGDAEATLLEVHESTYHRNNAVAAAESLGGTHRTSDEVTMKKKAPEQAAEQVSGEESDALSGRYRLGKQLFVSDTNSLYSGTDTVLNRPVNIQIVRAGEHSRAVNKAALDMVSFKHAAFSQVLSVDMQEGEVIIVQSKTSEFSLTDLVRSGGLPFETVRAIIGLSAEALEVAGRRGHLHGALTSDHIMVNADGTIQIRGLGFESAQYGIDTREPGRWARRDAVALMQAMYLGITGHTPVRFGATDRTGVTANEGRTPLIDMPHAPYVDDQVVRPSRVPGASRPVAPYIDEAIELVVNSPSDSGEGVADMHDVIELLKPWERPKDSIPVPRPAGARVINGQVSQRAGFASATYDDGPHSPAVIDAKAIARANRAFAEKPSSLLDVEEAEYNPTLKNKSRVEVATGAAAATGAAVVSAFKAPRERIVGPASAGLGAVLQVALDKGGQHEPPERVVVNGRVFNAQKFTLILVGLGVAVAIIAAVIQIVPVFTTTFGALGAARGGTQATAPATPAPTATSAAPGDVAPTTAAPKIVGVQTFSGRGEEKQSDVGFLFDGNPDTQWTTNTYRTQAFGNLKPLVGLGIAFEAPATAKRVTIQFDGDGGHVIVLPGKLNEAPLGEAPVLAEGDLQGGNLVLDLPADTVVDGLTVDITSLSGSGSSWRVTIKEITIE
ncbi:hypothetical protein JT358_07835 [Micrococcales bacterium 31B]|nr:hypothetical protein [Micrococcales bacterium 31B]